MKEIEKRARITVAYGGLTLLVYETAKDSDARFARAKLFAVPATSENDPHLIKAIRAKSWQKDYLDRLIAAGLITRGSENGQEYYRAKDILTINKIIQDHDIQGLRLSRFLFPNEAGIPEELLEEGEADPLYNDDVSGESDEEPEERPGEVVDLFALREDFHSIRDKVLGFLASMAENRSLTYDGLMAIEAELKRLQSPSEESQAAKEFHGYVKNRFRELEDRMKRLEDVGLTTMRAGARVEAALASAASTLTALQASVTTEVVPRVASTQDWLRAIWGKLDTTEAFKSLLLEFKSKMSDLGAVQDLAMKVVESIEKGESNGS